ncbi:MAG: alpha-ketoglutarate-dependent dioxygenase AlkB [Planctomycetota bacterium]
MDLFSHIDTGPQTIIRDHGEAIFWSALFARDEADALQRTLTDTLPWRQDELRIMGKAIAVPRLQCWLGDAGTFYSYSGIDLDPLPWTPELRHIRERVEPLAGTTFNSVLVNLYRDQHDHVSWHADDERGLGQNPVIASVSLGATRTFQLKRKGGSREHPAAIHSIDLTHGSMLLMRGELQHEWLHRLRKQTQAAGPRLNLTFRVIHPELQQR